MVGFQCSKHHSPSATTRSCILAFLHTPPAFSSSTQHPIRTFPANPLALETPGES
ncbi:hypothetical protein PtA15_5A11 [Puccinia triticina]|uniref:Uncharacterized protein n=1 Tax=Puccinia triticina TaxID=208348 RepID=A0ABY7CGT6_9BASI|nr:uncharacterized protein PtA15_5A11 [Puccinia triticina]WAQ84441.1 hypothetical protein PtA15_5A11 [Puccinia triticina]